MSDKQNNITEVDEARALMGWDGPAVEIEAPQTVSERRGGKWIESDRPAFVKIYTSFKQEMKDIDPDALKVWLFIALSVNRYSGEAHPGLRAISDGVGMAVNTVRAAVERLEMDYKLLQVEKEEGKTNKYFPVDYVSAVRETVSPRDTVQNGTVSNSSGTVSKMEGTVSTQYRKSAQPEEPDIKTREKQEEGINPLFSIFMNNISMVTPIIADAIEKAEKEYSFEWVKEAIELAGKNGAKSWNYCEKVLERWKREGKSERPGQRKQTAAQSGDYRRYANVPDYATEGD